MKMPRTPTKTGSKNNKGQDGPSVSLDGRPPTPTQPGVPVRQVVDVDVHQPHDAKIEDQEEVHDNTEVADQPNEFKVEPPNEECSDGSQRLRASNRIYDETLEDDLVEWLQENPVLWDAAQKDFRIAKKKDRLWEDKAKELDKSGEFLKGWYKNMRDQFVKLQKERSENGARRYTYREEWLLERFKFLVHTIKYRNKRSRTIGSAALANALEYDDLEQTEHITAMDRHSIEWVEYPMAVPSPEEGPTKKKRRAESPNVLEVTRQLSTAQTQVAQLQQQLTETADKRTAYLEYMKTIVKDITEEEWDEFHRMSVDLEFKWRRNARQRQQQSVVNVMPLL